MDLHQVKDIPILSIASLLGLSLKAGKNNACFNGHGKDTPCLHVYEDTNSFNCFSCDTGGSVIDLVASCLDINPAEAISWIKEQYGVKVTNSDIYKAFLELLPTQEAETYLKNRGLTSGTIAKSKIKAIPKQFDYSSLKNKYGGDALLNAGILASTKNGYIYPSFASHRLVIPYFDMDGVKVLTLQGRNIDTENGPKYKFLSGAKTPIYNMQTIRHTDSKVYITEGVIDCLSCYELGITNPVAISSATSKSIYDPAIFNRLGKLEVVIAVDNDSAGQKFSRDFIEQYQQSFNRLPSTIDWDKMPGVKDLNEVLKAKDVTIVEKENKVKSSMKTMYEADYSFTVTPHKLGDVFKVLNQDDYCLIRDGFITIGGEASTGKTSFVTGLIIDLLKGDENMCFLFYTLDDSKELTFTRMLSQLSNKNLFKADTKQHKEAHKAILQRIVLSEDVSNIKQDTTTVKKITGCSKLIIAIDYLQIVPMPASYTKDTRHFFNDTLPR